MTTFELPGYRDMWTVVGGSDGEAGKPKTGQPDQCHSFLILSREDSTMILQTGEEINELDASGFFTQGPTVFTGNIGENKYIVQVNATAVSVVDRLYKFVKTHFRFHPRACDFSRVPLNCSTSLWSWPLPSAKRAARIPTSSCAPKAATSSSSPSKKVNGADGRHPRRVRRVLACRWSRPT